jgi:protein-S-isoprenylcysteine O-methyltransferase Ste14
MVTDVARDTEELIRTIVRLPFLLVLIGVLLFWPAGTLSWGRGWRFLGVLLLCMVVLMAYLWRANPEIYAARNQMVDAGTKAWDLALMPILGALLLAILVVAALDDARFRWSPTPDGVVWSGYLLLAAGFWLSAWAQGVNRHFEPSVRIQTDRGHRVVDTGPYAVIRHPGYASCIFLGSGIALGLGSWWALVPAALLQIALGYRTLREEATLRAELPGYAEYMRRVKYRWVPGVW